MTAHRRIQINIIAATVSIVLVFVMGVWITIQSTIPVTQISNEIITPQVHAGDPLTVRSRIYRHRLCSTIVERTLFDWTGRRFVLPDISYQSAPGLIGEDVYAQDVIVPPEMQKGPAKLIIGLYWRCSVLNDLVPLRDVLPPLAFTIH